MPNKASNPVTVKQLDPVFTEEEVLEVLGDGFEIVLLKSSITPEGFRVRHYPYDTLIGKDYCWDERSSRDVSKSVDEVKKAFIRTLKHEIEKSGFEKGVVYFSPANRFSTVNTEAVLGYVFQTDNELETEINFIIKGETK